MHVPFLIVEDVVTRMRCSGGEGKKRNITSFFSYSARYYFLKYILG